MNTVLIIFLVLVIVISIGLAFQYFNPDYLISGAKPLLNSAGQTEIKASSIDMPGASRYFYEGWFYIHHNAPVYSANVLFNRGDDFVAVLLGSTLHICVNTKLNGGTGVNADGVLDMSGVKPIVSIPDFPFQKWAHIVAHVDGMTVDVYLDGKLAKTAKNSIPLNVDPNSPIRYGNKYTVGDIARFRRPAENINPQKVWNSFMMGSGQSISASEYHLNMQITKNKQVRVNQRLF